MTTGMILKCGTTKPCGHKTTKVRKMNYKGFYIKKATDDLIHKFIDYRETAFLDSEDSSFHIDKVEAGELFKQHRVNSREGILLFNSNDDIVGEMFVTSATPSGAGTITKIHVLKSERKKGAGTFLVRVMERLVAINKCKVICTYKSDKTIGFFHKLGYRPVMIRDAGNLLIKDISGLLKTKYTTVTELLAELEKTY